MAPHGMVACPHYLASQAGVDILKKGGTAVDAAIATNAVLNVVYPHMCGIGGDAFWLIYDAAERDLAFLNASGRSPYAATLDYFQKAGMKIHPPARPPSGHRPGGRGRMVRSPLPGMGNCPCLRSWSRPFNTPARGIPSATF